MRRALAVLAVLVMLWTAAGCSSATLAIVEPTSGAVIKGTRARIRAELTGGRIIFETTPRLAPDEGHLHLKLDGKLTTMTPNLEELIVVTPGPHVVELEFVANDHLPFNPRVISVVAFKVE